MILGIGTDLVAVARIARVLERNPRFVEKVFSGREQEYCNKKANPAQSYAARFAAKEAVMKALGTGWDKGISFVQIEVIPQISGKPEIELSGAAKAYAESLGIRQIHLSLSHESEYAAANVVLEK